MSFADQIPQSAEAEHHLGLHKAPDDLCSLCAADAREREVQAELAALRIKNEALKAQRDELLEALRLMRAACPPGFSGSIYGNAHAAARAAIAKAEGER